MVNHAACTATPAASIPPAAWPAARGQRHRSAVARGGPLLGAVLVVLVVVDHALVDLGEWVLSGAVWPATDRARPRRRNQRRLAPADEFFLHVETPAYPQHIGGVAVLDSTSGPSPLDLARLRGHVAGLLPGLTRLTRGVEPAGPWRHHRWSDPSAVDLDWHIRGTTLPADAGWPALAGFVADLASRPLNQRRPLWRIWLVHGLAPGRCVVVVVVHHAVADGFGLIALLRNLLTPPAGPAPPQRPTPGRLARTATAVAGLTSLATDLTAARSRPFPAPCADDEPLRRFQAYTWPLPAVRAAARQLNLRVTDLLLAAVGEAVRACLDAQGRPPRNATLRTAVPATLRAPSPAGYLGPPGNLTAGLLVDVPLGRMTTRERAQRIAEQTGPHATARALAGATVVRAAGALPTAAHRMTARQMYRSPHFDAIVTNMPGPAEALRLLDFPLCTVHPIVPLADGVPLAVGAMGWNGHYCLSTTIDTTRLDPTAVGTGLSNAFQDLLHRSSIALPVPGQRLPAPPPHLPALTSGQRPHPSPPDGPA
ncbi:hypothetical protein CcI49_28230 [Frankia sp. CcI49]|uniref:wax ester/triacylglycerol synthase domain-containing protein n=1 Tax=Frankia sp. CcI49 TaxID=1745382 RepID=UPI0009789372|nr:wax ester/triacylglycerol synthase domain-containing protein [Frankia sp. CcI49]ONH55419.1 hypothetical protein CcI49_28230 [Frankia sp. CcI49]